MVQIFLHGSEDITIYSKDKKVLMLVCEILLRNEILFSINPYIRQILVKNGKISELSYLLEDLHDMEIEYVIY